MIEDWKITVTISNDLANKITRHFPRILSVNEFEQRNQEIALAVSFHGMVWGSLESLVADILKEAKTSTHWNNILVTVLRRHDDNEYYGYLQASASKDSVYPYQETWSRLNKRGLVSERHRLLGPAVQRQTSAELKQFWMVRGKIVDPFSEVLVTRDWMSYIEGRPDRLIVVQELHRGGVIQLDPVTEENLKMIEVIE